MYWGVGKLRLIEKFLVIPIICYNFVSEIIHHLIFIAL